MDEINWTKTGANQRQMGSPLSPVLLKVSSCYLPGSFFLATVALGLLIGGRSSVKQLCDKAIMLKARYK